MALHYASVVFEGTRLWRKYLQIGRSFPTLTGIGPNLDFEVPWTVADDAAKAEVLKRNRLVDAYVRAIAGADRR